MSEVFKLNGIDWKKLGKGLLIACGGAGLTYLGGAVTGLDFGTATPMIVAGLSFGINFLRKFLTVTEG
jgi:hypothetical protein